MARVLTAGELASLRKDGQRTELYLAILTPDTVYSALLNGTPSSDDLCALVPYDTGSGTPGDTRADMSVYVGSTAGAYDKGIVRLREAITAASGNMKVGELSDVDWADGDHLTFVREWLLWPKHLRIDSDGIVYMDYETAYGDVTYSPHKYPAPLPIVGPHAVAWLDETGEAEICFDASPSYTVGGAGVMSYAWSVVPSDTASFDNATSVMPTLTVTAADTYTIECTVTWTYTDGGRAVSTTTYRHVFAFDGDNPPVRVFQLGGCSGAFESGGWSFSVTAYDEARLTEIRDRSLCVLFARDWFGPTSDDAGSIGPLAKGATPIRENVIACGWVVGETIEWHPEQGTVGFEVQGPKHWLDLIEGFPSGIEDSTTAPTDWLSMQDLTPRRGTAMFWLWRSTGARVMDAFIFPDSTVAAEANSVAFSEGEERQIAVYDAPPSNLGTQISTAVWDAVRAHVTCDRYGRLFVQRNLNEILDADRTAGNAPTVMTLTGADWRDAISFERRIIPPSAMLDLSGVAYKDAAADALFSLSPGHIYKQYGTPERLERLALWSGASNQDLANALCGLVFGNTNNEYPVVTALLAANNRAFDIAPWQYGTLVVVEGDTERGISGTFTLIPRRVSFNYDQTSGMLLTDIEWEAEGIPGDGIPGDPPPEPPDPTEPPDDPPLPPVPPTPLIVDGVMMMCHDQIAISFDFFAGTPTWYDADPSGDLAGVFQNLVVYRGEAWVTTRDDNNQATTGLWYCADTSAAIGGSISWTMIKSVHAAAADTGYLPDDALYSCCFGALGVNDSGQACALIHSMGNRAPQGHSGTYIGSSGSVSFNEFSEPSGKTDPFYQESPSHRCLHSVGYGEGVWGIAGKIYELPTHEAFLAKGPAWAYLDFYTGTTPHEPKLVAVGSCGSGYAVGHEAGQVYSGWRPASVTGLTIERATGIWEDTGETCRLYLENDGAYDLYRNGTLIGDASSPDTGFGIGMHGSMAQFVPGSNAEIVWVVGSGATLGTHRAVIYTEDSGTTWLDKTGNLTTALSSATWNGWSSADIGNSIARVFES